METSQPASLQEPSLYGTQLVAAVVIDKSSGNTSIKSRTMEISLNFGSSILAFIRALAAPKTTLCSSTSLCLRLVQFNYLLEEFSGELAHIDPIPPGIEKADFDLEEEIRLVENLLYDNSSPRPPEELNLEIADTIFESLSPSPILVEDRDIRFLEELLNNDSLPLPKNESSNLDHFNDPSPSRPPPEPPDVEICFDFKPDTGVVTNKVVGDISEHDVLMPNLLPTQPTLLSGV
ncbi:hypothetical protein Tco_0514541 [Tanacetum coccineum]